MRLIMCERKDLENPEVSESLLPSIFLGVSQRNLRHLFFS